MQRLRVYDLRLSRLPGVVGICAGDTPRLTRFINSSELRMLYCKEAGEESWWGTWAEMVFNVDPTTGLLTAPRSVARIEALNVCNRPIPVENQFFEYLQFGNGRMPKTRCNCPGVIRAYSRNNVVTPATPVVPTTIRLYPTDLADVTKRVLLQGTDQNGNVIYTQDGLNQVAGVYVVLAMPFVNSPLTMVVTGIQKDITMGTVQVFSVDPVSSVQTLITTMDPTEQTPWYRQYFINPMPTNCCNPGGPTPATIQVTGICKLEHVPVYVDQDYTIIQNVEAFIEAAQAVRYSEMDTPTAAQLEAKCHKACVAHLNGELTHYLGKDQPAVNFRPFGSARLRRQRVGTLV